MQPDVAPSPLQDVSEDELQRHVRHPIEINQGVAAVVREPQRGNSCDGGDRERRALALIDRAGPVETGDDLIEWVEAAIGKGLGLAQKKP